MLRVAATIYSIVGTTLAGIAIVVALVSGFDDGQAIIVAAALGAIAGLPVAWLVARSMMARG